MDAEPESPGKLLMRHTLRGGSALLACVSLLDLGRESFSGGVWRSTPGLHHVYGVVVSGYALTREWEKWGDGEPDVPRWGHLFMVAWVIFPVVIWVAQLLNYHAAWPSALNETLAWVFGAWGATKASRGLRRLTRARKARAAAPPAPEAETPDQYWARHALRFGSMLLGVVCLADTALSGFTVGEWYFVGSIHATYYLVLGAYASTREWEKWTDRYDEDAYWGHWFVWAWLILTAAMALARQLGFFVWWPPNLNATVATVVGIFLGGKASKLMRAKAGPEWWGYPGPAAPERPASRPSRKKDAAADEAPADEPAPAEKRGPSAKEARAAERAEARAKIIAFIQNRGAFTYQDVEAGTGLKKRAVRVYVTHLIEDGLVRDLGGGRFIWVGRGGKSTY